MTDTGYKGKLPDGMWEAARVIWENTPSLTDRDLLVRMQELYGEQAPKTHSTIFKRRNKEKWVKKNLTDGNTGETGKETTKKPGNKKSSHPSPTHINNKETEQETENAKGNKPGNELTVWQEVEEKVKREAIKLALSIEEKAEIIFKHRKRLAQLGELQENTIGVVNSLHGLDPKLDGDEIVQTIQIAETLSKTLKQLTDSQKVIAEQEMPLSGITPDDFHQSESEKRQASIEALAGIAEQERMNRQAKLPELMARLHEIENMDLNDLDNEVLDIDDEEWGE